MGASHGADRCFQDSISVIFHRTGDPNKDMVERCSGIRSAAGFNDLRQAVRDELHMTPASLLLLDPEALDDLGSHLGGYIIHTPCPGGARWLAMIVLETQGGSVRCMFGKRCGVLVTALLRELVFWFASFRFVS